MMAHSYSKYRRLGGFLDQVGFQKLVEKVQSGSSGSPFHSSQVAAITLAAGIVFHCSNRESNQRVFVYELLRENVTSDHTRESVYITGSDIRMFAEMLRIAGDIDSLNKLSTAFPHMQI